MGGVECLWQVWSVRGLDFPGLCDWLRVGHVIQVGPHREAVGCSCPVLHPVVLRTLLGFGHSKGRQSEKQGRSGPVAAFQILNPAAPEVASWSPDTGLGRQLNF